MIPTDLAPLANHLWQSTLFAAAVGVTSWILRNNRATVRHRLWMAASVKFLVPFSLLMTIGSHLQWPAAAVTKAPIAIAITGAGQPFTELNPSSVRIQKIQTSAYGSVATGFLSVWIIGLAASVVCWFVRWRKVRRAMLRATPLEMDVPIPVMSCPNRVEPGVFGIFRPVLLLPEGVTARFSAEHLDAVLAHELCHVRRRDNLTAVIHMFVEALFWFHPLVWWIKVRLADEQERACDEEVLELGADSQIYAESILKVCEFYLTSPLICVSGITGSDLKRRIREILSNRTRPELSLAKKGLLAAFGVISISVPVVCGSIQLQKSASAPIGRALPASATLHLAIATSQAGIPSNASVVNVASDGSLQFNHESIDFAALVYRLRDLSTSDREKTVVIIAAVDAQFQDVVRIVDATRAAGIEHIGILKGQADGSTRLPLPPKGATVLSVDRSGRVRLNGKSLRVGDISSRLQTIFKQRNDRVVYVQAYGSLSFDAVVVVIDAAKAAGATQIGLLSSND